MKHVAWVMCMCFGEWSINDEPVSRAGGTTGWVSDEGALYSSAVACVTVSITLTVLDNSDIVGRLQHGCIRQAAQKMGPARSSHRHCCSGTFSIAGCPHAGNDALAPLMYAQREGMRFKAP